MNNKDLLKIIIKNSDLDKYKPIWKSAEGKEYPRSFSASGMLIDELAYSAGQWTEEDLHDNNFEYEPCEPYNYNFEADLFAQTKIADKLYKLAQTLGIPLNANWERIAKEQKLQAGACIALNNPEEWVKLLQAYIEKLKENCTESISKVYNEALQEEQDSFWQDLRKEWLHGDRDSIGVIRQIQKYFGAEAVVYNDKEPDIFIFFFDKGEAEETIDLWNSTKATIKNYKHYLLDQIVDACKGREYKDKQEREKRKAERERLAEYKKERENKEAAERKAKLLLMTLK